MYQPTVCVCICRREKNTNIHGERNVSTTHKTLQCLPRCMHTASFVSRFFFFSFNIHNFHGMNISFFRIKSHFEQIQTNSSTYLMKIWNWYFCMHTNFGRIKHTHTQTRKRKERITSKDRNQSILICLFAKWIASNDFVSWLLRFIISDVGSCAMFVAWNALKIATKLLENGDVNVVCISCLVLCFVAVALGWAQPAYWVHKKKRPKKTYGVRNIKRQRFNSFTWKWCKRWNIVHNYR